MSVAAPQQQVEHGDHGAELLHPALCWAETRTLDLLLHRRGMRSPGIEDTEDDNVEDDAGGVDDDGEAEDLLRVRVGDGEQEAGQQHQVVHQQRLPQVFVENPLSQNLLRHYAKLAFKHSKYSGTVNHFEGSLTALHHMFDVTTPGVRADLV